MSTKPGDIVRYEGGDLTQPVVQPRAEVWIIGTHDEPGNSLGPWTEHGRAEGEEAAKGIARSKAVELGIHDGCGVYVMAWKEGTCPKWACTVESADLQGGWSPTITLPAEAEA